MELRQWRIDEERRLEEEAATEQRHSYKSAMRNAQKSETESQTKSSQVSGGSDMNSLPLRYRRYAIEDIEAATQNFAPSHKIAEGGYGPVFRCNLDHTPVAVKVLRPDGTQGQEQFQQEVMSYDKNSTDL